MNPAPRFGVLAQKNHLTLCLAPAAALGRMRQDMGVAGYCCGWPWLWLAMAAAGYGCGWPPMRLATAAAGDRLTGDNPVQVVRVGTYTPSESASCSRGFARGGGSLWMTASGICVKKA